MKTNNNLNLAVSLIEEMGGTVRVFSKRDPKFYHIFYEKDGANRVMLVPQHHVPVQKLCNEVAALVGRTQQEQLDMGPKDGYAKR